VSRKETARSESLARGSFDSFTGGLIDILRTFAEGALSQG
jgi:hypothetical protein